ncbi:MAG TPA: MlaD family protein [Verrucomicrobiae bacterium]|jgi:ABC-type transporter Mla subunit MlaD|nr:MlaD family protein [Verrucomicrobiae bacterium]
MNDSRLEWKVGLFVFLGLALIAALILNFSRGITLFKSTYELKIVMPTVAGLKATADVMMAGVPVGKVKKSDLREDGRSVTITAVVLSKYRIRKESKFHIDALGFLGDSYIEVTPPAEPAGPTAEYLKDGDTIAGEAPFNLQEAVRSTAGLLDQAKQTMKDVDSAITNINRTVLSEATLADFTLSLSNIENLSETAMTVVTGARQLLSSNSIPVHAALTNFVAFSEKVNGLADNLDGVIVTNRETLNEAIKNFRDTAVTFKQLAADLQAGRGVAGGLLKDEQMKQQVAELISNVNLTAESLTLFGSNLNQRGVWAMLWKPKAAQKSSEPAPRRYGK